MQTKLLQSWSTISIQFVTAIESENKNYAATLLSTSHHQLIPSVLKNNETALASRSTFSKFNFESTKTPFQTVLRTLLTNLALPIPLQQLPPLGVYNASKGT